MQISALAYRSNSLRIQVSRASPWVFRASPQKQLVLSRRRHSFRLQALMSCAIQSATLFLGSLGPFRESPGRPREEARETSVQSGELGGSKANFTKLAVVFTLRPHCVPTGEAPEVVDILKSATGFALRPPFGRRGPDDLEGIRLPASVNLQQSRVAAPFFLTMP